MKIATEVRPGANRYVSGNHILKDLPNYLSDFKALSVLTGEKSFAAFSQFYKKMLPYPIYHYDGTASVENGEALADTIGSADAILAIGGGRLIDTAKVTARALNCELIIIPTLVSNCAAYTPIGALYHTDHTFDQVAYFPRVSYLTLVDYDFLLDTPHDYLVAGIGDTLAKWYEMEGIIRHETLNALPASVHLGFAAAKVIFKILFEDSAQALSDLKNHDASAAFGCIADTVIELSGTVGGFAGAYGRMSGAHALHNGLSLLTETHEILHGSKVAYGVLVQLAYTNDFEEIKKLLPFYKSSELPTQLQALHLKKFDAIQLQPVADFAASKEESYRLIDPDVTGSKILSAIEALENFVAQDIS